MAEEVYGQSVFMIFFVITPKYYNLKTILYKLWHHSRSEIDHASSIVVTIARGANYDQNTLLAKSTNCGVT